MKRVGVFLIVSALVVGMSGCDGASAQYTLSVSSTSGGTVIHPGEGTFTYPSGAVVLLEALPEDGYSFANWSGDISTIEDVNTGTTAITMNEHCLVTANFVQGQPVHDWHDLDAIRSDLDGHYVLMNDIGSATAGYENLASAAANEGKGWQPIGNLTSLVIEPFTGLFDGQGYTITNLYIDRPEDHGLGLFACVGGGGVVKNVGIVDSSVTGAFAVGGLAGAIVGPALGYDSPLLGTISNCYATGIVVAGEEVESSAGGLVGLNEGNVTDSYAASSVYGNEWVGGLVGANGGKAANCYATGTVSGHTAVAGLVGLNAGNVTDSHAIGTVSGHLGIGGLVGINGGDVTNCYATGAVSGDTAVGGLIGAGCGEALGCEFPWLCTLAVSCSYATGNVTGTEWVGGLVGIAEGPLTNCYATGSVAGSQYVGGLVGVNFGDVMNCYSTGGVSGGEHVGGLVGEYTFRHIDPPAEDGTVTDSFWDTETSGQTGSAGGTGKTTAEMQSLSTFVGAVWDIVGVADSGTRNLAYIWNVVNGVTYPFLSWEPVS